MTEWTVNGVVFEEATERKNPRQRDRMLRLKSGLDVREKRYAMIAYVESFGKEGWRAIWTGCDPFTVLPGLGVYNTAREAAHALTSTRREAWLEALQEAYDEDWEMIDRYDPVEDYYHRHGY